MKRCDRAHRESNGDAAVDCTIMYTLLGAVRGVRRHDVVESAVTPPHGRAPLMLPRAVDVAGAPLARGIALTLADLPIVLPLRCIKLASVALLDAGDRVYG